MGERFKHTKRGTTYEVVGEAEIQVSRIGRSDFPATGRLIAEGDKIVVYRCEQTGKLWARMPDEFYDGRFERLETRQERVQRLAKEVIESHYDALKQMGDE